MCEPPDHSGHRPTPPPTTADQVQAYPEQCQASDTCKIGQGGTENVRGLAGGLAMAMQAGYGEVKLDGNFTLELNGGRGAVIIKATVRLKMKI